MAGAGAGLLTGAQQIFAEAFSKYSGVNLYVSYAWVLQEEGGGSENGANNWLGIGITDTARYGNANPVWNDPATAGKASGLWLRGQPIGGKATYSSTTYPGASAAIRNIPNAKGPLAQIAAIQASGWASGGETALLSLYQQITGSRIPYQSLPKSIGNGPSGGIVRPGGSTPPPGSDVDALLTAETQPAQRTAPQDVQTTGIGSVFNWAFQNLPGLNLVGGLVTDTSDAISGVADFLKFIAWLFSPITMLRIVEFLSGAGLMAFGIHSSVNSYKESSRRVAGLFTGLKPFRNRSSRREGAAGERRARQASEHRTQMRRGASRERQRQERRTSRREAVRSAVKRAEKPPF